ncbi:MAG: hypothetical protein KDD29_08875 [Flavobacteriales bacterium]|nr:hypothetical protein [Flavobacteriales bacterium]
MPRFIILLFLICFTNVCLADNLNLESDSIPSKIRKMEYGDFMAKFSINDTSATIIHIFFDKRNNTAKGQMSFLPITVGIYFIFPQLGVGLTCVSLPLFINGSVLLIKYRKKKLYKVLDEYQNTRQLPKWVRKKAEKSLYNEQFDYE